MYNQVSPTLRNFLIVVTCSGGKYLNLDSGMCKPCERNFYQPSTAESVCYKCPGGTHTEKEGSTDSTQCLGKCGHC